jgi:hypothetical protein
MDCLFPVLMPLLFSKIAAARRWTASFTVGYLLPHWPFPAFLGRRSASSSRSSSVLTAGKDISKEEGSSRGLIYSSIDPRHFT